MNSTHSLDLPASNGDVSYSILADLVLGVHASFVIFVVLGLLLIAAGGVRGWRWVRNPWFRALHLVAIGVVVAQAWLGVNCPLTNLEMWFRSQAGDATYAGSFIAHWLSWLLYYQAPPWVFAAAYSLFGILVVLGWLLVPPGRRVRP